MTTTLLIVAGVFGMLCYVAWWNWEHSTITLTMVDLPLEYENQTPVISEERREQMLSNGWQVLESMNLIGVKPFPILEPGTCVVVGKPTYSAADDFQIKFKVEDE